LTRLARTALGHGAASPIATLLTLLGATAQQRGGISPVAGPWPTLAKTTRQRNDAATAGPRRPIARVGGRASAAGAEEE
jgi:hypothetical protein